MTNRVKRALRRPVTLMSALALIAAGGIAVTIAPPVAAVETISTTPSSYDPAQTVTVRIDGFPNMAAGNGYIFWLDFINMTGAGTNSGASTGTLGSQTDCTATTGVAFSKFSGSGTASPNGQSVVGSTNGCQWISTTSFRFSYTGTAGLDNTSVVDLVFPIGSFGIPAGGEYGVNFTAGATKQFQLSYVCWGNCPVSGGASTPPVVVINIDGNGGTCRTGQVTGILSTWTSAPDASSCSKPGFTFSGFNTSPDGSGIAVSPGGNLHLTGDNTLYAIYEAPRTAGAPTDVTAVAGRNQITVSWKAPVDPGSSAISNYLAQASPSGRVCITRTSDANMLSCTMNLSATNTTYSFNIQALNSAGWGEKSAASNAVSPFDLVLNSASRPKANFFQRLVGWGSIIEMSARAPGFAVGTAVIPQWKVGSGNWVSEGRAGVKVGSNHQISWSKKLKKNLDGQAVTVRFVSGDVATDDAALRVGSQAGLAGAPRDVKFVVTGAKSAPSRELNVTWQPPASDGGSPITSYVVSAQLSEGSLPITCRVDASKPLVCPLFVNARGLSPDKKYPVTVTAINARGEGRPAKVTLRRPV